MTAMCFISITLSSVRSAHQSACVLGNLNLRLIYTVMLVICLLTITLSSFCVVDGDFYLVQCPLVIAKVGMYAEKVGAFSAIGTPQCCPLLLT